MAAGVESIAPKASEDRLSPLNLTSNSDLRQSIDNQGALLGVHMQGRIEPPAQ